MVNKFCPRCSNIFAFTLVVDNNKKKLRHKCSSCQHEEDIPAMKESNNYQNAVLFTQKTSTRGGDRMVTPEMCFDRALPHVTNVSCPNDKCVTNDQKNKQNYQKYDSVYFHRNNDMLIGYICCHCRSYY